MLVSASSYLLRFLSDPVSGSGGDSRRTIVRILLSAMEKYFWNLVRIRNLICSFVNGFELFAGGGVGQIWLASSAPGRSRSISTSNVASPQMTPANLDKKGTSLPRLSNRRHHAPLPTRLTFPYPPLHTR